MMLNDLTLRLQLAVRLHRSGALGHLRRLRCILRETLPSAVPLFKWS